MDFPAPGCPPPPSHPPGPKGHLTNQPGPRPQPSSNMRIGSGARTPLPSTGVSSWTLEQVQWGHRTCLKERLSGRMEHQRGAVFLQWGGGGGCGSAPRLLSTLKSLPGALSEPPRQTDVLSPFLPDSELVAATGMVRSARALKCLSWRRGENRMRKHNGKAMGEGIRKALPSGSGHSPRDWLILRSWEAQRAAITCPFLRGGGDGRSERLITLPKVTKLIKRATLNTQVYDS